MGNKQGGHTGARLLMSVFISLVMSALTSWIVKVYAWPDVTYWLGLVLVFGITFLGTMLIAYTVPVRGQRNVKFGRIIIKALVFTVIIEIGLYLLLTNLIAGNVPFQSTVNGRVVLDELDLIVYGIVWFVTSIIVIAFTVVVVK